MSPMLEELERIDREDAEREGNFRPCDWCHRRRMTQELDGYWLCVKCWAREFVGLGKG